MRGSNADGRVTKGRTMAVTLGYGMKYNAARVIVYAID